MQIIYSKTLLYRPKYTSLKWIQFVCQFLCHIIILFLNQDISTVQLAWPRILVFPGPYPTTQAVGPRSLGHSKTHWKTPTPFFLRFHRITRFHQKEPWHFLGPGGPRHPGNGRKNHDFIIAHSLPPLHPTKKNPKNIGMNWMNWCFVKCLELDLAFVS